MTENFYHFEYDEYGNTKAINIAARGMSIQANNFT